MGFELTTVEYDYLRERAALNLPGFILDLGNHAYFREPDYAPASGIFQEVSQLAAQGYRVDTYEVLAPPSGARPR